MIDLFGKKYITDKEAAKKYSYSVTWFKMQRCKKLEPHYIKLHGRVYYEVDVLDKYFKEKIVEY